MPKKNFIFAWLIIVAFSLSSGPVFGSDQAAKITFLRGDALVGSTVDGPWEDAKVGMQLEPGSVIKTLVKSYAEFTLPDGSKLRLSPEAVFQIETTQFAAKKPRRFFSRLFVGKLWAKVNRTFSRSSRNSFKTATRTSVCGVRGTVYDLHAFDDKSTDIYVYDGSVAVGPPLIKEDADHEEMEWPMQVSENEWEEIILGKLQRLHIGSDGKPGKPVAFDPSEKTDEWTTWNLERDAAVGD